MSSLDHAALRKVLPELDWNDPDVDEELSEIVTTDGDVVFTYYWDSGAPGAGAGSERVLEFRGQYYYSSMDFGLGGPFDSVIDAIACVVPTSSSGEIMVSPAAGEIWSSIWTVSELTSMLDVSAAEPDQRIVLNSHTYYVNTGNSGGNFLTSEEPTSVRRAREAAEHRAAILEPFRTHIDSACDRWGRPAAPVSSTTMEGLERRRHRLRHYLEQYVLVNGMLPRGVQHIDDGFPVDFDSLFT